MKCPSCGIENLEDSKFCRKCATPLPGGGASFTRTIAQGPAELASGTVIAGRYQIKKILGRGGMGVVYLAYDTRLKRPVALKFLPPALALDEDIRKRFMIEAQAAASLSHPNICTIYEVDDQEEKAFISMEYVEGESLREKVVKGSLPFEHVLDIALQVCAGLDEAHKKGIVHRDIKSANIMLTAKGQAKIMDFGLAKVAGTAMVTKEGSTLGTVAYMSPEQAKGEAVDARTDIWSLGVVLFELASGKLPFRGDLESAVIHNIIHEEPKPLKAIVPKVPEEFERIVKRALKKKVNDRYGSAAEMLADLRKLHAALEKEKAGVLNLRSIFRIIRKPLVAVPTALVLISLGFLTYATLNHQAKVRWANNLALPEIKRLADNGEPLAAFNLAAEAENFLHENTKELAELRQLFSRPATITSDPPGATVSWKAYSATESAWKPLGQTPITGQPVPAVFCRLRIEKEGYQPLLIATYPAQELSLTLDTAGSLPGDMVRVPASVFDLPLPGLDHLKGEPIGAFLIDKYEVTNRAFKRFLDSGGYRDKRYWKYPFVADGRSLSWEEAMDRFRDRTGRTGPATWEAGDYPEGQDDYPVSGLSWHEAAAFADYIGKSLPTIYHWYTAAGLAWSADIVPLSNLGTPGPAAVGSYQGLGPFGTYDMAGNVREWCRNSSNREGQRFILGGGWNDPLYAFDSDAYTQPPFDRSASNGFRCVKDLGENRNEATLAGTIGLSFRDFFKEMPSSDKEFEIFLRQYAYDQASLNAEIISKDASATEWTKEKIAFDAAYGNERVIAYLFLPKNVAPPYQVVFHWPGDSGLGLQFSDTPRLTRTFDFIIKSRRAVMFPILKSMFERRDGLASSIPNETNTYKEHVIMWVKDVRRCIDYLQARPDIDIGKLAYFGHSWGGRMAGIALAVESRFKTAVLYVAGFRFPRSMPEVDPFNFVSRVKIPVLMLNGRYDHYFPVETAQKPMFEFLGTPQEHKKWIVYDGGHFVPRDQLIKETLSWLDKYSGPVK